MFCINCNKQVNITDKFCANCGHNLQIIENSENKKFLRKKRTTLLLFLIPYTSILGIHHFYNKKFRRGFLNLFLSICLCFFFITVSTSEISIESSIGSIDAFLGFIVFSLIIIDLKWILKLPNFYYVDGVKLKNNKKEMAISNQPEIQILNNSDLVVYKNNNDKFKSIENIKYIKQIPKEILELLWIKDEEIINKNNNLLDDPSLVDLDLEIQKVNFECGDYTNEEMRYYPSYSGLSPTQRYIYLHWLMDITKPINIGYVFIFYYGLERHLLFGKFEKAFDMISTLRKHHFNSSFNYYSENSILISIIKRNKLDYMDKLSLTNVNKNLFALLISENFKRFTAEDLISFSKSVGFSNHRYIKGDYKKFLVELTNLLKEEYGEEYYNIKEECFYNCPETFTLAVANFSLSPFDRFEEVPDILSNPTVSEDIYHLLQETHERVKILKREERKLRK